MVALAEEEPVVFGGVGIIFTLLLPEVYVRNKIRDKKIDSKVLMVFYISLNAKFDII